MHIYIHVPFCARRCSYCDFAIAVRNATPDRAFVDAIRREWGALNLNADLITSAGHDTLYFGGGTPSRLSPDSIAELIALVRSRVMLGPHAEITLEVNPDDVDVTKAAGWVAAGVNRVSLGVQSHDAAVLQWMHRTHATSQVATAVAVLRDAGIHNISMDLIFALPLALARDWRADLEQTLALEPTHLSLYGLTVEPHTALSRWVGRGAATVTPDDRYAVEFLLAHERLSAAGFEHYQVSNAALPGFRSRHNSAYWSGAPYLGLGPSAHSFVGGVRRWNVREWADYQRRLASGESVLAGSEQLDAEAIALERRYLGLRTLGGVPEPEIDGITLRNWCREGWAGVSEGIVRLTPEGWLRLDALVGAASHS